MSKAKKKDTKPVSLKKETFNQVSSHLNGSLGWLKELLGDKKFDNRIKKASRILSDGIKGKKTKNIKPQKEKKVVPAATETTSEK